VSKKRTPLLDIARLRAAISKATNRELSGAGLPFSSLALMRGERSARFALQGHRYVLALDSYALREESETEADVAEPRLLSALRQYTPDD
jgi:hypothetical protein